MLELNKEQIPEVDKAFKADPKLGKLKLFSGKFWKDWWSKRNMGY